jgi:sugar phosphate isomerase/epimerase
MKIAVQLTLIPGATPGDRARWAKDHGVDAIELVTWNEGGFDRMRREADAILPLLPVSSICGNIDPQGERSFDFLHPDPAKRRASIDGSKRTLDLCGQIGAAGQIVPPIFGPPVVPDLSPAMTPLEIEEKLMIAACQELGPYAAERKTLFMLEPLNRYEQHYLRKQSDGVRVKLAAGVPGIGLLSDFFHMHIEETNTPQAFRDAAPHTTHIHLADNTRMEPGSGDIDFVAAFKVLHAIGYSGYMSYECGITGANDAEKFASLDASLRYVRDCIVKAHS